MARPLFAGAAEVGDTLRMLPLLFHLMWLGRLVAPDLGSVPLGAVTLVEAASEW